MNRRETSSLQSDYAGQRHKMLKLRTKRSLLNNADIWCIMISLGLITISMTNKITDNRYNC